MSSVPALSKEESNLGSLNSFDSTIPQTLEKNKSDKADYFLSKKDNKGRTLTTEEQQKLRNSNSNENIR